MSSYRTLIPENWKLYGRVYCIGQAAGAGVNCSGFLPSKSDFIHITAIVTMGSAANQQIAPVIADDAGGTGLVALSEAIVIHVDDVRQSDATSYTITEDTGTFVVGFTMQVVSIPIDKYVLFQITASNAANIVSAWAFERKYYGG